jgi:hypothetical protein
MMVLLCVQNQAVSTITTVRNAFTLGIESVAASDKAAAAIADECFSPESHARFATGTDSQRIDNAPLTRPRVVSAFITLTGACGPGSGLSAGIQPIKE